MAATTIAVPQSEMPLSAHMRGKVGMWCLIAAESAIFSIFVVAYLYYAGKSLSGPTPAQVLEVPIFDVDLPVLQQPDDCAGGESDPSRQYQTIWRCSGC